MLSQKTAGKVKKIKIKQLRDMDDRNTNTRIQEIQKTENEMFKVRMVNISELKKIQRPQIERAHRLQTGSKVRSKMEQVRPMGCKFKEAFTQCWEQVPPYILHPRSLTWLTLLQILQGR